MNNKPTYQELETEVNKLREEFIAKKILEKENSLLKTIFNECDLILFSLDKNYCYLSFNENHFQTIKKIWNVEIAIGMNMLEMISLQADRDKAKIDFDIALAGESIKRIDEYGDEKFSRSYYEDSYSPLKDSNGNIYGLFGSVKEITKLKITEETLIESEKNYKKLVEIMPDGVYKSTHDGEFVEINPAMVKILGYDSKEELLAADIKNDLYIEDSDRDNIILDELNKELGIYQLRKKDGSLIWVEDHGWYSFNESGEITYHEGIMRDVTERIQKEQELIKAKEKAEESERKLIEAQELAHVGSWEYIIDTDTVTWSKEIFNIFERSYDLPAPNYSEQRLFYTKESFDLLDKAVQDCVQREIPYEIELDIIVSDGSKKQIIAKGNVIKDKNNKIIGSYGTAQDITQKKKNEREIIAAKEKAEESEARFKVLHNASFGGIAIHNKGLILDCNQGLSEISGFNTAELIGMNGLLLIAEESRDLVKKNILSNYEAPYEVIGLKKNGEKYPIRIEGRMIPYKGEIVRVVEFRDITSSKKNEQELIISKEKAEESKERLNFVLKGSDLGFWDWNIETNEVKRNKRWAEMLGYTIEEIEFNVKQWTDLIYLDDREKALTSLNNHLSGKIPFHKAEYRMIGKNNQLIWILDCAKVVKRDENGKPLRMSGTHTDITERKFAEIELVIAKERAQESDKLKSAFLANMSHEIRTPMNGILGFSELLKSPKLSGDQQQKYIGIIEKSGNRMLNIINDIVDISKIEAGLMNMDIKECNINEQIEYIYTFFKPEIESKGMQFFFKNTLPADEVTIKTDREKVFAILTNLVKNAIKYSNEGSIEFGYVLKTGGEVAEQSEIAELEFFIKDTGIGIPKDRQAAIFERFIQADVMNKMARQGTGLGLSITKTYVEMLGGKIWLKSEEGVGSTFYFTLPYTIELEEKNNTKEIETSESSENHGKNLKILIAEDDEVSEMLLSNYVSEFSDEIITTRTGTEAVGICRNNPDIDLIMMDIQMPEMNGYEATRQIREFNKDVIIIAQTAFGLSGDREKSLDAGCNDYITKPINKSELDSLIQKYFTLS